jgi:hypothetical protein
MYINETVLISYKSKGKVTLSSAANLYNPENNEEREIEMISLQIIISGKRQTLSQSSE